MLNLYVDRFYNLSTYVPGSDLDKLLEIDLDPMGTVLKALRRLPMPEKAFEKQFVFLWVWWHSM